MRESAPIVSTDWLAENLDNPGLVILDIRVGQEYKTGHIPQAVNIPFPEAAQVSSSAWFVERDGLLLELPETAELFNAIGSAGIKGDSIVVVIAKRELPHPLINAARVADLLMYAGVKNAAVLDGGYDKWLDEGRPTSRDTFEPTPVKYNGKIDVGMFVSKEYVRSKIGKAVIIDVRDPKDYFGVFLMLPIAQRAGHIPTAKCFPASWLWKEDLTYRDTDEIRAMAAGVVGEDTDKEIIIYCGLGGASSAWLLVLREVLGYKNVKIYNGSTQDWSRDPETPMVLYKWE